MFQSAYAFNQDISTWDMHGIPDIASMFNGATNYTKSVGAWNFTTINDFTTAFINSGFSTNFLKTSLFIIDLANNPTVTSKNLGNLGKYLNNTTTAAAVSVLLSRSNTLTGTTSMTPDITTFKTSGYSISDLLAVGYTLANLYTANYTLADLSNSGFVYTPTQLIAAGYTAFAFKNAGYTFEQIVSYGFEVADLVKAGFSVSQIMTLGYSPDQLFYGGIYDYSDLIAYGYSVPGFMFDLSSSVWNALPSAQYPIVNTGGSFSDLSFSAIPTITTGKTHVVIRWSSYTNRAGSDGLSFAGVSYSNHASIVIKQFDSIPLRNMVDASSSVFHRFAGRIVALDTPAIVNPGMAYCFANASTGSTGYGRVGAWNLTGVTNISYMFAGATGFNSDISGWNTGAVTNMAGAFQGCSAFNQDLRGWNVANVTDMSGMFSGAVAFNSDISGWNVSKVVNMSNMFNGATVFGASVGKWNVTAATSMTNLVNGTRFSTNYLKASMLLQDMSNNTAFTGKALGTIGTYYLNNTQTATAVTRLTTAHRSNTFTISATTPNLSTFKTSGYSATDLVSIGYTAADLRTAGYSLTELSGISIAPADLKLFGYTVANFKAAGGYTLAQIYAIGYPLADFRSAGYSLSELIGVGASPMDLFTSGVYDYSELVPHGLSIPGFLFDLSSSVWNALSPVVYPVVNTGGSFTDLCFNVIPNTFTSKTNVWVRWSGSGNGSNTGDGLKFGTAVSYSNHPSIVIKQFGSIPLVQMTDISSSAFYRFSGRITATDTPRISQNGLAFCFYNNATVSGGGNGISGGLNIGGGCSEFGNIGAWDVSGVTNMSSMFFGCSLFNSDISGWNTGAVTNMSSMFAGATTFNSAIGRWNVSSVTNMSSMFAGATAFNRDISGWNIGNVASMPNMFKGAASFEQPIGNWNFSSVTNMVGLLDGSAGFVTDFVKTSILLQDLSNNPTFTGKVVGPIGSYLNNPQTAAAVTSILNKDVVIAVTLVI